MSHWDDWADDKVWSDTITYECEEDDCDFKGDLDVECEGNGERWTAYYVCPHCGTDGYTGGS